jgi:hypothetical protein
VIWLAKTAAEVFVLWLGVIVLIAVFFWVITIPVRAVESYRQKTEQERKAFWWMVGTLASVLYCYALWRNQ